MIWTIKNLDPATITRVRDLVDETANHLCQALSATIKFGRDIEYAELSIDERPHELFDVLMDIEIRQRVISESLDLIWKELSTEQLPASSRRG